MSNLEILKEIKREYNPKTAFGNPLIIKLIKKIVLPDKNGNFKITGDLEEIIRVSWRCVDCGRFQEEDLDIFDRNKNLIKIDCKSCGAKHLITL
jgi:DNA-directed RNA polymerase subunit RPC12/RpoP